MDWIRQQPDAPAFLAGGGETGALMRVRDWSAQPLGPPAQWPQPLRTLVAVMLDSRQPMFVAWGPARIMLYNDAYAVICGDRHPTALGRPFAEVWADILDDVGPILDRAFGGESTHDGDIRLLIHREGRPEERHFAFSYTPVRGEGDAVEGMFCACAEITQRVMADRRQAFLLRLTDALRPLGDALAVQEAAARLLGEHLGASRVGYAEVQGDGETIVVTRNWCAGVPGIEGRYRYDDYGSELLRAFRAGRTVVRPDVGADRALDPAEKADHAGSGLAATVNVPLVKAGKLVAVMFLHFDRPHDVPPEEVALIEEVAERTWAAVERASAEAALRESEARFRTLAEAIADVFYIAEIDPPRILYVSASYAQVWGRPVEDLVANPQIFFSTIHPEDRERLIAGRAEQRSGEPTTHEYRILRPDGSERWILDRSFPVPGHARARAAGVASDVTLRKAAEAALRANQERQAFLLDLGDAMRAQDDQVAVVATAARMLGEALGASRVVYADIEEAAGVARLRHGWSAPGTVAQPAELRVGDFSGPLLDRLRAGETVRVADTAAESRPDLAALTAIGVRSVISVPLIAGGQLVMSLSAHQDDARIWTDADVALVEAVAERTWSAVERARASEALRSSEARLRQIVDAAGEYAIITLDADGGITGWNLGAERLLGWDEAEVVGRSGDIFFTPEDRAAGAPERELRTALDEGRAANERWHLRRDSSRFWGSGSVVLLPDATPPARMVKIFRDRTEERLAEERRSTLVRELNHRVRNTLAVVQSIGAQTFRGLDGADEARTAFADRLRALASAHDILTEQSWLGADMRNVVDGVLRPFRGSDDQFFIEGPPLFLSSGVALALALALHELATNAIKYGSLSRDAGRVMVLWSLDADVGRYRLSWRERGGPLVDEPTRAGFGSTLIRRALAVELGGEVNVRFAPEGLEVDVEAPLPA